MVEIGDVVVANIRKVEMPAIVTKVWSEDCVNLIAFSDLSAWKIANEYVIPQTSVVHVNRAGVDNDHWRFKGESIE